LLNTGLIDNDFKTSITHIIVLPSPGGHPCLIPMSQMSSLPTELGKILVTESDSTMLDHQRKHNEMESTTEDKNGDNSDNSSEKYNDGACT
jgi:hypothetical protein